LLGGEDQIESREVLDAIDLVSTRISRSSGYDLFIGGYDHNTYLSDDALMKYDSGLDYQNGHEFTNLAWLGTLYNNTKYFDLNSEPMFLRVSKLFDLQYWKRVWILQESVLAEDKILLCGPILTPWVAICRVFTAMRLVRMQYNLSTWANSVPKAEWILLSHLVDS
jgi:hypothetical protein